MRLDRENRESRGSVSYTDYYSNEDGQIRKLTQMPSQAAVQSSVAAADALHCACSDLTCDDDDHTLTLKQSEEQERKQDVKSIFEHSKDDFPNPTTKLSGSYKKIGRYAILMEIRKSISRLLYRSYL